MKKNNKIKLTLNKETISNMEDIQGGNLSVVVCVAPTTTRVVECKKRKEKVTYVNGATIQMCNGNTLTN